MSPPGQSSGPGKGQRALPGPFLVMDTAFLRILSWDPATLFPEVGPGFNPRQTFSLHLNVTMRSNPARRDFRDTERRDRMRVREQCQ